MKLSEKITEDLSLPRHFVREAIHNAPFQVKIFHIPKNSGGERRIFHPAKKTKTLQYWLLHNVFSKMPVHKRAMAFVENTSILENAKAHRHNNYFLKTDFKEFFPSIGFEDFLPVLRDWHNASNVDWELDQEAIRIIRESCFFKGKHLAIGYPSSPIISNIVMYNFDIAASAIASDMNLGSVIYTRYADDITFSTDKKGACSQILKYLEDLTRNTDSPNLEINDKKTRFGSRKGGTASVTGLRISDMGHITINRRQKDHIRLLLSLYAKGRLGNTESTQLIGHLAYCQHVAPRFYTTLQKKYFRTIAKLRQSSE